MNRLEIRKEDLKFNIDRIFEKATECGKLENKSPAQIIGVVKINAYDLGLVPFSKFLIKKYKKIKRH